LGLYYPLNHKKGGHPMKNTLYDLMINNFKNYLRSIDTDTEDNITAFQIAEVLAIGICKDKVEIIADLVRD